MKSNRKTATIVGVLFIVGTLAGIISATLTSSTNYAPYNFNEVTTNKTQIIIGTLLIWLMGFSLAMISLIMYPILKKYNEILATGYVVFRGAVETITYLAIGICMLSFLNLSQNFVKEAVIIPSNYQNIGFIIMDIGSLISITTIFVFSLGALMFYLVLFQSKLIPRWLSIWGLVAIILHLVTGFLILFGLQLESSTIKIAMNFPIFLQEMVMAIWLIVKGFNINNRETIN